MNDVAVRITAPHFCCAIIFRNQVVIEAAPIVKYMKGWTGIGVENYLKKKKWKGEIVQPELMKQVTEELKNNIAAAKFGEK